MRNVFHCRQGYCPDKVSARSANLVLLVLRFVCLVGCLATPGFLTAQVDRKAPVQEEAEDYFLKWLDEDVVYIITDEERTVFQNLTTIDEKEQFIEQFWLRRDPTPGTAQNEFKEEHYRRLAYTNEQFSTGKPGWRTDRGRIYVIHGPPTEIEAHPTGGQLTRSMREGGGRTTTYPFEVWRYRHIEGLGDDIVLEFVDKTLTGEYRLALLPDEKDALLYLPGSGPTIAEELGLATKSERPYFSPQNRERYPGMLLSERDNPFLRYENFARIQGPKEIKYKDLKGMVDIDVGYNMLPLTVEAYYFRLNKGRVLVPVTFQLPNKDLTFQMSNGSHTARVAVYGVVTNMSRKVVAEFEDDLTLSYQAESFQAGLLQESVYQKILPLESRMRYKLDLVVKDLNSKQVGVVSRALIPPKYSDEDLQASPLIFSNSVQTLQRIPDQDEMFVIGDVKIRPNIKKEFTRDLPLSVYFQLYNAGIDQTVLKPSLAVTGQILQNGTPVGSQTGSDNASIRFFSDDRVVLIRQFDLSGLQTGIYQVRFDIHDRIRDRRIELSDSFKLVQEKGHSDSVKPQPTG